MPTTTRKLFKFEWFFDDSTTYVSSTDPRPFQRNVDISQIITIDIKDDIYSVDPDTIKVYLNGYDITSAVTINSTTGGYRVVYRPTINYAYGVTVGIRVRAANSEGYYMPDYSYYFRVKRRRLNDLIEAALKKIAKEVDWSKVIDDRF